MCLSIIVLSRYSEDAVDFELDRLLHLEKVALFTFLCLVLFFMNEGGLLWGLNVPFPLNKFVFSETGLFFQRIMKPIFEFVPSKLAQIPFFCLYMSSVDVTQVKCNKKIMTIMVAFGRRCFVTNQVDFSSVPCELIKVIHLSCIFQHRLTQRFLIVTSQTVNA